MSKFIFILSLAAIACGANGQTVVVVNPNGTHSIMIEPAQPGLPGIIVHPNGQHSAVYNVGVHAIAVGPDGRHSVLVGAHILGHSNGNLSMSHSTEAQVTSHTAVKNKRKTELPYIFMPAALRRHLPRVLLILPLIK